MRAESYAVESILRVLRQQGLGIAARTFRAWKRPARIAARTVTDALVEDKIRDLAWRTNPVTGFIQMKRPGFRSESQQGESEHAQEVQSRAA